MKTLIFFCFALTLLISASSMAQVTAQWTSIYNGVSGDTDEVSAIAVDNSGNVFVTGFSKSGSNGKDIVTLKYDPQGQQLWSATYNNSSVNGDDIPTAIAFDGSGNVIVTGRSLGQGTFLDMITIKYSPDGNEVWSDRYNGEGNDVDGATAVVVDASGNVIVTGYSVGEISSEDFTTIKYTNGGSRQWISKYNDPSGFDIDIATSVALDNSGNIYIAGYSNGAGTSEDIALVKYSSSGSELWVQRYNGAGNNYDISTGIAIDNNSNVLVSGFTFSSSSQDDYLLLKYDASGAMLWTRTFNGSGNSYDITCGLALDQSGNCFVSGYSYSSASGEDYLTVKYSSEGTLLWDRSYNGSGNSFDIATAVKSDKNGNAYITGFSYDQASSEDYVTLKYDASGSLQWAESYDGPAGESDIANSLAVDASANIYVSGFSFEGSSATDYITVKYSQTVGIDPVAGSLVSGFVLNQNYPNPFNPATTITYDLVASAFVDLVVYDQAGRRIAGLVHEKQTSGHHEVNYTAVNLPSGMYAYRLTAINPATGYAVSSSKKMILTK